MRHGIAEYTQPNGRIDMACYLIPTLEVGERATICCDLLVHQLLVAVIPIVRLRLASFRMIVKYSSAFLRKLSMCASLNNFRRNQ